MNVDAWMNISGISGVSIYLLAWWWNVRGVGTGLLRFNQIMRLCGLLLILGTLFMQWYLSASLILYISLLMVGFFGGLILATRSKA